MSREPCQEHKVISRISSFTRDQKNLTSTALKRQWKFCQIIWSCDKEGIGCCLSKCSQERHVWVLLYCSGVRSRIFQPHTWATLAGACLSGNSQEMPLWFRWLHIWNLKASSFQMMYTFSLCFQFQIVCLYNMWCRPPKKDLRFEHTPTLKFFCYFTPRVTFFGV